MMDELEASDEDEDAVLLADDVDTTGPSPSKCAADDDRVRSGLAPVASPRAAAHATVTAEQAAAAKQGILRSLNAHAAQHHSSGLDSNHGGGGGSERTATPTAIMSGRTTPGAATATPTGREALASSNLALPSPVATSIMRRRGASLALAAAGKSHQQQQGTPTSAAVHHATESSVEGKGHTRFPSFGAGTKTQHADPQSDSTMVGAGVETGRARSSGAASPFSDAGPAAAVANVGAGGTTADDVYSSPIGAIATGTTPDGKQLHSGGVPAGSVDVVLRSDEQIAGEQHEQQRRKEEATDGTDETVLRVDTTADTAHHPEESGMADLRAWRRRRKHVLIFSDAGKPIFTRYGDETDFAELFGILQVLMEMATGNGLGALRYVSLGTHDAHFLERGHLRFVIVNSTEEHPDSVRRQLVTLHNHLISSFPSVNRVLGRNSSYDVRPQIDVGLLRTAIRLSNHEPALLFHGISSGVMPRPLRAAMQRVLLDPRSAFAQYTEEDGGHLLSLVVCEGRILAAAQLDVFELSTNDLQLLVQFAEHCERTTSLDGTWTSLCLPEYDPEAAFWVHVCPLSELGGSTAPSSVAAGPAIRPEGPDGDVVVCESASKELPPTASDAASARQRPLQTPRVLLVQLGTHTDVFPAFLETARAVREGLSSIVPAIVGNAYLAAASTTSPAAVPAAAAVGAVPLPPTPPPPGANPFGHCAPFRFLEIPQQLADLGVAHMVIMHQGTVAVSREPNHVAQDEKHRKAFFRTLVSVRQDAHSLARGPRQMYVHASGFETICYVKRSFPIPKGGGLQPLQQLQSKAPPPSAADSGAPAPPPPPPLRPATEALLTFYPSVTSARIAEASEVVWNLCLLNKEYMHQMWLPRACWPSSA
jgi:hypothetical protein